jgi:hypothetical protein
MVSARATIISSGVGATRAAQWPGSYILASRPDRRGYTRPARTPGAVNLAAEPSHARGSGDPEVRTGLPAAVANANGGPMNPRTTVKSFDGARNATLMGRAGVIRGFHYEPSNRHHAEHRCCGLSLCGRSDYRRSDVNLGGGSVRRAPASYPKSSASFAHRPRQGHDDRRVPLAVDSVDQRPVERAAPTASGRLSWRPCS